MSVPATAVSLLVFEAAGCLMAVPASEVSQLESDTKRGPVHTRPLSGAPQFDLGQYFSGRESDGPWLRWTRGTRSAWLRVRCVVDVVPVALSVLSPMPRLLGGRQLTRAFLAAGVRGDDVFLLLDPARLTP